MALPIRPGRSSRQAVPPAFYPATLELDAEHQSGGLPWLSGELGLAAPACLKLILRIHNRAGIPIVEAHSQIEAGQQQITFSNLHALGIEAYAHKTEAERAEIAQRIWSRRAYGTLTFLPSS
jgi:hypothetical protein